MRPFLLLLINVWLMSAAAFAQTDISHLLNPNHLPDCAHGKNEAKYRQYFSNLRTDHGYDVRYYKVDLEVEPETELINGTVEMTAASTEDGLTTIELDLNSGDMTVESVALGETSLDFTHENNVISINLGTTFNTGEVFTVSVTYYGTPTYGIYFFPTYSEVSTTNEPSDVRNYLPCFDDPSDKADSLSINLTFPTAWNVYSNGILRNITDNGTTRTHHWHTQYPISTYLIAFIASPDYEVLDLEYVAENGTTMPMPCYVFDWQYDDAVASFREMPFMMESLVSRFGEYPFLAEKYGQGSFHVFMGGMENQTITLLHSDMIDGTLNHNFWLYSHELGHQWWGDLVTCETWGDIWLNEGFATYVEALYFETYYGDIRPYIVQASLYSYLHSGYDHPLYNPPPGYLFSTIVYEKGGLVLHMLRGLYGDQFFDILTEYRTRYAYDAATTAEFQQVCEDVTGDDLDWFFNEWVYDQGYPRFDLQWDMWQNGAGTYTVEMVLEQTQIEDGDRLFQMPLQVGGNYSANPEEEDYVLETIQIDTVAVTYATITLDEEPLDLAVDPYEWFIAKTVESQRVTKFAVAQITIADADNDQLLEAGETANLIFGIRNSLSLAENVTISLMTDDPDLTITTDTAEFGTIASGGIARNDANPFAITIDSGAAPHEVLFTLLIEWGDGSGTSTDITLAVGPAQDVLIVNDSGTEMFNHYYTDVLNANVVHYQTRDNLVFGSPTVEHLENFDAVIWYTGNQTENTLTEADQTALAGYLDNGGNLLLTGQGIAGDLRNSTFYTTYLHAQANLTAPAGQRILQGMAGDPIGDGLTVAISGGDGANNQTRVFAIAPLEGAERFLNFFPGSNGAALHFAGDYKLIYLTFGFEAVTQRSAVMVTRNELMRRFLMFLDPAVDAAPERAHVQIPESYFLSNYPNPFNPKTTLSFALPQAENMDLSIYTVDGRRIKTLLAGRIEAGEYSLTWDGTDEQNQAVSSGIYLYRLDTSRFSEVKSMVLLK